MADFPIISFLNSVGFSSSFANIYKNFACYKRATVPFASNILGNYNIDGVTIANEIGVTPFIVIPEGHTVSTYNTDLEQLDSFIVRDEEGLPVNIKFLIKKFNAGKYLRDFGNT